MGRAESLYRIVGNSTPAARTRPSDTYRSWTVPDLLYPFLGKDNNKPRINEGLLKALARIGDAQSLDMIKPYRESHQPYVAEAAETAHDEIEKRLAAPQTPTDTRAAADSREGHG